MAKQAADAVEWSVLQHRARPLLSLLVVSAVFLLLVLRSSYPSTIATKEALAREHPKQLRAVPPADSIAVNGRQGGAATAQGSRPNRTSSALLLDGVVEEVCDMSKGRWVREPRGPVYTNVTCYVLPDVKNCGKYGKDHDYQYWRWQPDGCELPRFDPAAFLGLVRGKKMAFIGDSLAGNQMESLLCLLSMAEAPMEVSDNPSDRFPTWYFPMHDFTLMAMWTQFFVDARERVLNGTLTGSFDIHLDKMDVKWTEKLPGLNYAILSGGNWLLRRNYLHERGRVVGCIKCTEEQDLSDDLHVKFAIRKATRAALEFISQCKECAGLTTLLRTFTFSHFEHGSWYSGGYCNKTTPLTERQIDLGDLTWEIRNIQVQEVARIRGLKKNKKAPAVKFGLLDVTKAMMMRADGHPGTHWSKIYGKVNDCLHWCLPGPIDMWSDVLLATLTKNIISS